MAEWYLTFCLLIPLGEAKFYSLAEHLVTTRSLAIFRITPYNLMPTDLYFLSLGFAFGLLILLMGRRNDRVPARGTMFLPIYWLALGSGVLYGFVRGNISWLEDFRAFLLPTIVIPWMVVLIDHVRIQVVLNRMIRFAAALALLNALGGGLYFVRGNFQEEGGLLSVDWRACYVLLLYYCLAFARTVGSNQKTPLSLICLALGILLPLHKPVLATFFAANVMLVALSMRTGRRFGNVRIGSILLTLVILVGIGVTGISVALSLGKGAGKAHLLNRIFKYNVSYSERDVSGGRIGMWTQCLVDFAGSPVFGTGMGNRIIHISGGETKAIPIHNLYIQLLFQIGLVGSIPVAIIAVIWLARAYGTLAWEPDRANYWPRLGVFCFILAVLFGSGYGDALGVRAISYTFWTAVAFETWAHSRALAAQGR